MSSWDALRTRRYLAAMNTATFHPNSGDEIAAESYEQLAKSSALAKQLREEGGHENSEHYASPRFLTMPAPVAYKILQCEKDYVHFQHDRHDLDGFTYIDYV